MARLQRIEIAPKPSLRFGPRLIQAVELLSRRNADLGADLARTAATNPFLRVTGGVGAGRAPEGLPSLYQHVAREIGLLPLDEREQRIAGALVEHLAPSGWLERSLEEIAGELDLPVSECLGVLEAVQRIEPAGLFARTLAECLALQAREAGALSADLVQMLRVLDSIEEGGTRGLAEASGVEEDRVVDLLAVIRGFDPKPGAQFEELDASLARAPDLLATRRKTAWHVRINPAFRSEIAVLDCPSDAPLHLRRLADRARALRDMVARRHDTVERIAGAIVRHQSDWLLGAAVEIAPLRRQDVARAVEVHETTVGRVTSEMTVETPRGVLGLDRFFSRRVGNSDWSVARLRARIAELVASESGGAMSDAAVAAQLRDEGVGISRRSVARHRRTLGLAARSARKAR